MRTRLIFLLIFAVTVYGMVYVGQQVAQRAAQQAEQASVTTPPGEATQPDGMDTEPVISPDPAEAELPDEGGLGDLASHTEPEPAEPAPEVGVVTGVTEAEPIPVSRDGTGIEGYVFHQGRPVAGARVAWRPSHDSGYIPPSWSSPPLDSDAIQNGAQADFTTENPLNPGESNPIRLGGGFVRYDTAIARSFATKPGTEYELSVDSRYVHSVLPSGAHGEGERINLQIGEFGVDLTGQTMNHESPTIQYQSVTDGPNNCWERYRMEFTAEREKTSVWLHAKQLESQVGLVWFDRLMVRPVSEEEATPLLESPAEQDAEEGRDDYVGSVLTGLQGYFRIEGISAGEYDLCAASAGKGSAQKDRVRVTTGKTASVQFNLLGGGVVRGKVLENLFGDPIPGAVVTAKLPVKARERVDADNIPEVHTTQTGNSGRFYLHGLLPGVAYHVTVKAPGYVPPRMQSVVPDGPDTVFALSPEGGVFGLVVEAGTEKPVEGAVVRVFQPAGVLSSDPLRASNASGGPTYQSGERLAAAVTNAEGQFTVSGLDKGVYRLVAEKNGRESTRASGDAATIRLDSRVAQAVVTLQLPGGGHLRGKAVDISTKKPVAGVDLILTQASAARPQPRQLIEDLGDFVIRNLSSGLVVQLNGETPDEPSEGTSEEAVEPGVPEEEFFRPRVCVRTEEDGSFAVDGIGTGFWRMGLRTEDYRFARGAPTFVVGGGGQAEVDVLLAAAPAIEGIVVDEGGLAVEGVRVWPRRQQGGSRAYTTFFEDMGLGHSGRDGRFRVRGVHPGVSYDLVATAQDGRMALVEGVKADQREVEIVLEPFGSIEGEIRFESGKPLVGAKVTGLGGEVFGIHWWRDGRTDGEGRFRVQHLPTGSYDLDFGTRWPELHARYGPVRVERGEEITGLELIIPGHGKMTGTVRFGDGSGAPGILVTAIKLDQEGNAKRPTHWTRIKPNPLDDDREPELQLDIIVHEALTDEAGDYVIADLLPGSYEVNAHFPDHLPPHERMDVVRSQTVQLGEDPLTGVDFAMVQPIEYDPPTGTTSSIEGVPRVGP